MRRPETPTEPEQKASEPLQPEVPDPLDEGLDESLELTYPASDPPRPVRIRPDSDTGAGRTPVD
jgi:hypothetical protein